MNREKLAAISAMLRKLDFDMDMDSHFDMGSWGVKKNCGFAGCAIGWAAHKGILPELQINAKTNYIPALYNPEGWRTAYGFEAVATALDISEEAADWLFGMDSYDLRFATPCMVADRIDAFLARG